MGWETEIPDVIAGEPIESAWGNQIRDQVVHVVANVAALPVVPDGGLAYVEAEDILYVRANSVWTPVSGTEVDGAIETPGPVNVNFTSLNPIASLNLIIPTTWVTWKCAAHATFTRTRPHNASVAGTLTTVIRIDGTDQQTQATSRVSSSGSGDVVVFGATGGRRTGMTTTGSRTIALMAMVEAGAVSVSRIYLYARAVRTS